MTFAKLNCYNIKMMRTNLLKILVVIFFLSFGTLSLFRYWQGQIREKRASDFAIAHMHYKDGRYAEALRSFRRLIESHPRSKEAISSLYYLGLSLIQLGENERAIYYFRRLKNEFPASNYLPGALYHWARAEEELGNLEKSFQLYKSIRNNPLASHFHPDALVGMGRVSKARGDWEDARDYFQDVMNSFPQAEASVEAKKRLGKLNINLLTSPVVTEHCVVYEVAPMDTLTAIAARFNTTVELIMKRNNLETPIIRPMQTLIILNGNFHIVVDVSENILTLYFNEEFVTSYPVATGAPDTPTPLGEYTIVNKVVEPEWRGFPPNHPENILGTRWLGLNKPGYGIHGTVAPASIGTHITAGCIRMFNEDVEELFDLVPVGTVVRIIE